MKKLFSIFCLCLMCICASAQVVDNGRLRDNWYVSGGVGTTVWDNQRSWAEPNDAFVNVTVGKEITPIFGLELDFAAGMNQGNKTFFDSHDLTANIVTNMSNLVLGYKGEKRFFEPSLVIGAGWYHTYGTVYNNVSAHAGVDLDFNVSDKWALTISPDYTMLPKSTPLAQSFNVSVGATYRLGKGGFPIMKLYDAEEIEELNSVINELRSKNAELETKEPITITKTDTVVVTDLQVLTPKIQFLQNSSEIASTSEVALSELAGYINYVGKPFIIEGYASEEGPAEFNTKLSIARAEEVKKALVEYGVSEDSLEVKGLGSTTEFGDREFNRIVIVSER